MDPFKWIFRGTHLTQLPGEKKKKNRHPTRQVADEEIAIQTSGVQHQGPTHFPSVAGHRFDVLLRHLEMKD